ncbi:fimbrial protein [Xenorhabdus sp. Sc-CR9]|uniref:fimbrial protein n=1 Tax=Xenorhabdus sp. Sc-CR9 TaxID=2584468 RepID=UPI001F312DCD|nr:fimbrial protein [Xenorhabdus sp. Sc-CR9]
MKLNKLAIVLGFGVALTAGAANAVNQGSGTVKFTGSIIDAPCSIKNNNVEVNLGQISSHILKDGGRSESHFFKIELENCTDQTKNGLQTTFTGRNNGVSPQDLLGIEGTAKGAAIAITNAAGKLIRLGTKSDVMSLSEGNNDLHFAAYLQGINAPDSADKDSEGKNLVVPGNFTAIANFSLNYL